MYHSDVAQNDFRTQMAQKPKAADDEYISTPTVCSTVTVVTLKVLLAVMAIIAGIVCCWTGIAGIEDALGLDDGFKWSTMSWIKGCIIGFAMVLPWLQGYSIYSTELRIKRLHCGDDGSVMYDACSGHAVHRNDEKTCTEWMVEMLCLSYSGLLLLGSWSAVVFLALAIIASAVAGGFFYLFALLCEDGSPEAYQTISMLINVTTEDNSYLDTRLTSDLDMIQNVYCAEPDEIKKNAGCVLAVSSACRAAAVSPASAVGRWTVAGTPITLVGVVIMLVLLSAVYKSHSEFAERKEIRADMKAGKLKYREDSALLSGK